MKTKCLLLTLLLLVTAGLADWEAVGPYGGYLRSVVVSHTNDNIVYAVSYNYPAQYARSTNGGATWTTMGGIPSNAYATAIDPTDHNKLYTGGGSYFYRSTNGGTTWLSTYASNTYPYGMVVNSPTPTTVYGAGYTYDGTRWRMSFYKSSNSGASWSTTYLADSASYAYCIGLDRTNPSNIYVGGYTYMNSTYYPMIYKSSNGGTSWTQLTNGIPTSGYYVYSVAVHPTNSNIIYLGIYTAGIYRSTDAGASWTQVSTHYYNYAMATSIADPNAALVTGYNDVYKTTNAGATWFADTVGFKGLSAFGLAMSQTNGQVAYVGDNMGAFKTTNGGARWSSINNNLNLGAIASFAVAPSSPSTIYTSFEEVGVFKTTNSGTSWTQLPTPVACGNICEFAVHRTNPLIVYGLEGSG